MTASTAQLFAALGRGSLLTTGSLMLVAGSAFAWLRSAPTRLLGLLERRLVTEVEIRDDWTLYGWTLDWLASHPAMRRNRKWIAITTPKDEAASGYGQSQAPEGSSSYPRLKPHLQPGLGSYLVWFEGRPVFVNRSREEAKTNSTGQRAREHLTLRFLTRDRERVTRFIEQVIVAGQGVDSPVLRIAVAAGNSWSSVPGIAKRSCESVVLRAGEMEEIVADIERFLANQGRYRELGIPWHRGYAFFGAPGGGKTSLVQALAAHFNRTLHVMNLGSVYSDDILFDLIRNLPANAFLLIEDVDAAAPAARTKREDASEGDNFRPGVSLSALLNALDGVFTKDGMVTFLTSNFPEKLDPALLRPGRIDFRLDMGRPSFTQCLRLYKRFFPESGFTDPTYWAYEQMKKPDLSMATMQGELARQVFHSAVIAPDEPAEAPSLTELQKGGTCPSLN